MDIFNSGLVLICTAFILILAVVILVCIGGFDRAISITFIACLVSLMLGFILVITGCFIKTFSKKFEVVGTAPIKAKDNYMYYIDPRTEDEVEVKIEKDTKIYPTSKPSYVEFSELRWLCFTVDNTTYYISVGE